MAIETMAEALAVNVRREMDARGWCQSELARRCGWEPARITEILKGNRNYRLATVERLAKVFEVVGASLVIPPTESLEEILTKSNNRA